MVNHVVSSCPLNQIVDDDVVDDDFLILRVL